MMSFLSSLSLGVCSSALELHSTILTVCCAAFLSRRRRGLIPSAALLSGWYEIRGLIPNSHWHWVSHFFSCPHLTEVKRGSRNLIPDRMITCEPSGAAGGLFLNWASITGEGGGNWLHYNQYGEGGEGVFFFKTFTFFTYKRYIYYFLHFGKECA